MGRVLRIHPADNVAVALENLAPGERVTFDGVAVAVAEAVPARHKFAVRNLAAGDPAIMYGMVVGEATRDIPAGGALTPANVRNAGRRSGIPPRPRPWSPPDLGAFHNATFDGYWRSDGRVGTANYWLVAPLVFCENRNLLTLREALTRELGYGKSETYRLKARRLVEMRRNGAAPEALLTAELEDEGSANPAPAFPNVDGVKFLFHEAGCGGPRQDSDIFCGLMAGYITHPNVAGATILSLGCQNAQVEILQREIRKRAPEFDKPLVILEQQRIGSESKMMDEALRRTIAGLAAADQARRRPAPMGKLVVGVECGGSDGFSGISANPAIGHCCDLMVAAGGTAILSEFPELWGVEQDLIERCVSAEIAERFLRLLDAYARRAEADGSSFEANPSPGNIREGLLTIAMKSAGAARKGGTSPVTDVLDYPEPARRPGLNLLCTPGNDVESTTGLAAAGATLMLFSTGMGAPTGNPVTPVIKVSSSTSLFQRMSDIIDADAGGIIEGVETIESVGKKLLSMCLEVAGGKRKTRAMELEQDDFIPWRRGISL